tara:strand:- start:846 stop:1139 length:294 start_codon:yes stop_codon:yes gene_type:complete
MKKIREGGVNDDVKLLIDFVAAFTVMVVLAFDFGILYSKHEEKIYQHPVFLIIAGFCVCYEMLENVYLSILIVVIWFFIKYILGKKNENKRTNKRDE